MHTVIFKMDNQQGLAVYHMELCSTSCGSVDQNGVWGRINVCISICTYTICICMAEPLCCSSETIDIATLLTVYTPIQKKGFFFLSKLILREKENFFQAKVISFLPKSKVIHY